MIDNNQTHRTLLSASPSSSVAAAEPVSSSKSGFASSCCSTSAATAAAAAANDGRRRIVPPLSTLPSMCSGGVQYPLSSHQSLSVREPYKDYRVLPYTTRNEIIRDRTARVSSQQQPQKQQWRICESTVVDNMDHYCYNPAYGERGVIGYMHPTRQTIPEERNNSKIQQQPTFYPFHVPENNTPLFRVFNKCSDSYPKAEAEELASGYLSYAQPTQHLQQQRRQQKYEQQEKHQPQQTQQQQQQQQQKPQPKRQQKRHIPQQIPLLQKQQLQKQQFLPKQQGLQQQQLQQQQQRNHEKRQEQIPQHEQILYQQKHQLHQQQKQLQQQQNQLQQQQNQIQQQLKQPLQHKWYPQQQWREEQNHQTRQNQQQQLLNQHQQQQQLTLQESHRQHRVIGFGQMCSELHHSASSLILALKREWGTLLPPSKEWCELGLAVYKVGLGMYHSSLAVDSIEFHYWEGFGVEARRRYLNDDYSQLISVDHLPFVTLIPIDTLMIPPVQIVAVCCELAVTLFTKDSYDLINCNCNHFTAEVLRRLGLASRVPLWINRLAFAAESVCSNLPFIRGWIDLFLNRQKGLINREPPVEIEKVICARNRLFET